MGGFFFKDRYSGGYSAPDINNDPGGAPKHSGTKCHALIACLDYTSTPDYALTSTLDGNNMQRLLSKCGVEDVTVLYDSFANTVGVAKAMRDVGSRCAPGDYFIFYFSGHGTRVVDLDGDEDDGFDEAMCLQEPNGKYFTRASYMIDDEVAALVPASISKDVKFILLTDCCHSGSIGDLDSRSWGDIEGVAFAGCTDVQESEDTGEGGIFTHAMLMAISKLNLLGDDDYSCAQLYNKTIEYDFSEFHSEQDIQISCTTALDGAENMAWPLIPLAHYTSPQHKKHGAVSKLKRKITRGW